MTIAYVSGARNTGSSGTTATFDSTGANLLLGGSAHSAPPAVPTDNKGNVFTGLTYQSEPITAVTSTLSYVAAPSVGAGHTESAESFFSGMMAACFSGAHTSPFDVENGAIFSANVTSMPAGSVTPSVDGCLVITHIGSASTPIAGTLTPPSGFTLLQDSTGDTNQWNGMLAYQVQTTATPVNPTWTCSTAQKWAVTVAVFKPSVAAPVNSTHYFMQEEQYS